MTLITSILLLLVLALVLGELLQRFGLAAVIGEILAGVILGPIVLNFIQPSSVFEAISEISLFFIILYIGVESSTDTFRSGFGRSVILTITSFLVPLGFLATFSFYVIGLSFVNASLLAIAISVPSISIISVLIKENSLVKTKTGNVILSSVVITDLVALVATSILIDPREIYVEVPGILVFILLLVVIDRYIRKNSEKIMAFFDHIHAMERGEKIVLGAIIVGG
ncbi:Cation/H+ exchanger, partial [mine drainage metagenome]